MPARGLASGMSITPSATSVLITGARGYIGRQLVARLAGAPGTLGAIVSTDILETPDRDRVPGVIYRLADVRDPALADLMEQYRTDCVVHLAAVVTPGRDTDTELEYAIDVDGSANVLRCCLKRNVPQLIVISSGAAYGYHPDNPPWLDEDAPLRGNDSFPYARHKRLIEELLARARREDPYLRQLIFRPGTILGERVANRLTALFDRRWVLGLRGCDSPFVFIWDQDVVNCLELGIREQRSGIYNLAGDGALTLREIAGRTGKPYLALPRRPVQGAIALLHVAGLTGYRPGQIDFLRYRPVLSNARLKSEFGYTPRKTTAEAFDCYWRLAGGSR